MASTRHPSPSRSIEREGYKEFYRRPFFTSLANPESLSVTEYRPVVQLVLWLL